MQHHPSHSILRQTSIRPSPFIYLSSVVHENSEQAWLKLLMLPKSVLFSPKRRGRHHKPISVSQLCNLWSKGELHSLWERMLSQSSSQPVHHMRAENSNHALIAVSLAREGLLSKACQVLTSGGIAPNNDTTWGLLQSKHPKSALPCPPICSQSTKPLLPPNFNIMAVLNSFPKDTACGPSGLRIQHLIDAAEVPLQLPITSLLHSLGTISSESGVQQGDPMGSLLFCLVLQKLVSAIAEDKDCSSLLFHKWHIDDSVLLDPNKQLHMLFPSYRIWVPH